MPSLTPKQLAAERQAWKERTISNQTCDPHFIDMSRREPLGYGAYHIVPKNYAWDRTSDPFDR